jgi:GntR family transcriptional regulator
MVINPQSPIAFYRQLADILRDKIERKEYPPETKIPSEHELAILYNIGRPTVRQALHELAQKGFLEARKGSGTYVRERPPEVDLFSYAGTSAAFLEKGLVLKQKIVKKPSQSAVGSDKDNPFSDNRACYFSRISLYKGEPVLLEEIFLDPALFPGIEQYDFSKQSLSQIVRERYYLEPVSCRQTFRAITDARRSALLAKGKSSPLLFVSRTLDFPGRESGIYSRLFYSTSRFTFSQTLRRSP